MAYTPAPGTNLWRNTFAAVINNNVDTGYWTLIQTGSGQTVNQNNSNLLITSGTTVNAETIVRSKVSFSGLMQLSRWAMLLSQRIANQNFYFELVDVIGDGLSYTITNATTVVVTIPNNPFTATNVGQGINIGAITGAAGVPMRATIASVSGNNVTFTVAGWPASGSGTCSLFGWNYQQVTYNGATATQCLYDAQRRGWNSGTTVATINTTASPGHFGQIYQDEALSIFSDGLVASNTAFQITQRASRMINMPSNDFPLYFQIRVLNGTSAPASTTTLTVGFVAVEDVTASPVLIESAKETGAGLGLSVQVQNVPAVTVNSGTVTTVSSVTASTPATPTASAVTTAASTNATSTKAAAGTLYGLSLSNPTATPMYFKLYNKASAPVVGTDIPVITIIMPASSSVAQEFGPMGLRFGTGIAWAATGAYADSDTTSAVAGAKVFLSYI